ncbi:hypothetical protein [Polymorphospora sp. A560]
MSTFEEYAALARHLSELRRAGERDAAADTARRAATRAAADQLGHRLDAQEQRLRHLGRAAGRPDPVPAGPAGGAGPDAPAGGHPRYPVAATGYPAGAGPDPTGPGPAAAPRYPAGRPEPAKPGQLPPPAGYPALPAAPVPGPRPPLGADGVVAGADPDAELESARQAADVADAAAHTGEQIARRPPLLPSWSPFARAAAVYAGCALLSLVPMFLLEIGAGLGAVGTFTLYAWTCAGLPVLAFFAGYLVLGRWGRPPGVDETPSRYVLVGFALCLVLPVLAYCGYVVALRTVFGG